MNRLAFKSIAFLALIEATALFGNLSATVALEGEFQQKLRSVLAPVDPKAIVVVNVEQRPYRFELPGLNLSIDDLTGSFGEGELDREDILKVVVQIHSRREISPVLRTALAEAIALPASKKVFHFELLEAERGIAALRPEPHTLLVFAESPWGVALLFAVFLGLLAWASVRSLRQATGDSVSRLVDALAPSASMPAPPRILASGLETFSVESAIALLSDCYWCHQDAYAAWLWARLSPSVRSAALERWKLGRTYVKSLSAVVPLPQGHHTHPSYLKPWDLSLVSLEGCEQWLRKNPGAWHALTPLRQGHIRLPLEERLRLEATAPNEKEFSLPSAHGAERILVPQLEILHLNDEDELALLQNPSFVPTELRKQVLSLAWVALLDQAERVALLTPIPAKDLAEVWMGPPQILESIEAGLSAKKIKAVRAHLPLVTPSRQSATMIYLVGQAVWLLGKRVSVEPHPSKEAA